MCKHKRCKRQCPICAPPTSYCTHEVLKVSCRICNACLCPHGNRWAKCNHCLGKADGQGRWTQQEHRHFLRGLAELGKKPSWARMARDYVKTRTADSIHHHWQCYSRAKKKEEETGVLHTGWKNLEEG